MSGALEAARLFRHDPEAVLGAELDAKNGGRVTVTLQNEGVVVYSTSGKRLVSYPLGGSSSHFLAPAVVDALNGAYHAVISDGPSTSQPTRRRLVTWRLQLDAHGALQLPRDFHGISLISPHTPLPGAVLSLHLLQQRQTEGSDNAAPAPHAGVSTSAAARAAAETAAASAMGYSASAAAAAPPPAALAAPPTAAAAAAATAAPNSCLAVVFQDGRVGWCTEGGASLELAVGENSSSHTPTVASAALLDQLVVVGQAEPGSVARLQWFSSGSSGSLSRQGSATAAAPNASSAAVSVSLSSSYAAVQWSDGFATIVSLGTVGGTWRTQSATPSAAAPSASPRQSIVLQLTPSQATPSADSYANANGTLENHTGRVKGKKHVSKSIPGGTAGITGGAHFLRVAALDATQLLVVSHGAASSSALTSQGIGTSGTEDSDAGVTTGVTYRIYDSQFGCMLASPSGVEVDPADVAAAATSRQFSLCGGPRDSSSSNAGSHTPPLLLLRCGGAGYLLRLQRKPATLLSVVGRLAVSARPVGGTGGTSATPSAVSTSGRGPYALSPPPLDNSFFPTPPLEAPLEDAAGSVVSMREVSAAGGADGPASISGSSGSTAAWSGQRAHAQRNATAARLIQALSASAAGTAAASPNEAAVSEAVQLLVALQGEQQPLPQQLLTLTLGCAAEAGLWGLVAPLVVSLPPRSLVGCGRLLACAAAAHQYELLTAACCRADEIGPGPIVQAVAHVLRPTTSTSLQARRDYYQHLRSHAEALVANSEQSCRRPVAHRRADEAHHAALAAVGLAQCAAAVVDGFTYREVLLHPLLAVPVDGPGLLAVLRTLNSSQVEALLSYLAKWVVKYTDSLSHSASAAVLPQELLFPTFMQVLEWARLVIDAHITSLMMAPVQLPALAVLEHALSQQRQVSNQLAQIRGSIEHMQRRLPLPARQGDVGGQYTAEVLDLSIHPPSS